MEEVPFPFEAATERVGPFPPEPKTWTTSTHERVVTGLITPKVKPEYRGCLPPGYIKLLEVIFTRPKYRYVWHKHEVPAGPRPFNFGPYW